MALHTLKKRAEFLRLRGGARWANRVFVLETRPRPDAADRTSEQKTPPGQCVTSAPFAPLSSAFTPASKPKDVRNQLAPSKATLDTNHYSTAEASVTSEGQTSAQQPLGPPRFGFTVTKKMGNAVTRNLIKRRLKHAIADLAPDFAKPGYDYVLIARHAILMVDFAQLTQDLKTALERIHARKNPKSDWSAGKRAAKGKSARQSGKRNRSN